MSTTIDALTPLSSDALQGAIEQRRIQAERCRAWRSKDGYHEYLKRYRKDNLEKVREYHREYMRKFRVRVTCPVCKSEYNNTHAKNHFSTIKHQNALKEYLSLQKNEEA